MTSEYPNLDRLAELEKLLEYKFSNINFLIESLSHPSLKQIYSKKHYMDYERLELLGDAILSFVILELLYRKFVNFDEGNLAKIKSFLVSKEILNQISKQLKLADFIIMTKGEENSGGRDNPSNVENAMEALIAAIYLDSNIEVVRNIIARLWQSYMHNFNYNDIDPKSALQEWAQHRKYPIPHYNIIEKTGPVHSPIYKISVQIGDYIGVGEGKSIKSAEKLAAKNILDKVDND